MDFWQTMVSKQADLFIGIFTTILGIMLTALLDKFKGGPSSPPQAGATNVSTHLTINTINQYHAGHPSKVAKDEETIRIFITLFCVVAGVTYLWFRSQILGAFVPVVQVMIPLMVGSTLYLLVRGYLSGIQWLCYTIFAIGFCIVVLFVQEKAVNPNFGPQNFRFAQQIVSEQGVTALPRYFTIHDLPWFAMHLSGVLALLYAVTRTLLSATYFVAMCTHLIINEGRGNLPWVARKTVKYGQPFRNMSVVTVTLVLAYYLAAGNFYRWFVHDLPTDTANFLNVVMKGNRS